MGVRSRLSLCLDHLVAPLFRRCASGQVLFFPFGALGRGRVVPDEATATELRTGARHAWIAFLCILLPLMAVFLTLTPNVWILLAMSCLALQEYLVFMATLVVGLELSGIRMRDCDRLVEAPEGQPVSQES